MNKPKLMLFDIGGVLIEYKNAFVTASNEQNIPHEIIWNFFDKYVDELTLGKITSQEFYLLCLKENNLKADPNYNFIKSWINDYEVINPTYNFVIEISKQYQIGLLSNIYQGLAPELIKQKLIPDIKYNYEFLSCDINLKKPDKEIYEFVEKTSGCEQNQILFIDDRDDNIDVAKSIGWQTHKFNRQNPSVSINKLTKLLLT